MLDATVLNPIAENVVFVSDNEGNDFYVPADKYKDFESWCETYPDGDPDGDYFEHATLVEGEVFVVDIVREF